MADEFLFPMTSRMSYTSTCPDSDGEFCDPETPVVSRQPSMILDSKTLDRYSSDPNLASQEKLNTSGIPDYNAPPPNRYVNTYSSYIVEITFIKIPFFLKYFKTVSRRNYR